MGVVSSGSAITATKTGGKSLLDFRFIVAPMTLSTLEFMVRFDLFDPTNIASSGLSVCLFEKTRKALPEPAAGDIILLRSIAVSSPHTPEKESDTQLIPG